MADFGNAAMQGFQTGFQSRGPSALGVFLDTLTDRMTKLQQTRAEVGLKSQADIQTQQALLPMKEASATRLMQEKARLFPPQARALSGDTSGKLSLASHGEHAAKRAKEILFQTDPTTGSRTMNRGLLGALHSPFGVGMVGNKNAQLLEFYTKRAVDAQVRSETGAAMPPDELTRTTREFLANALANPDAAFERLDQLESGLRATRMAIDPTGTYATMAASPFEPRLEADGGSADADEWEVLQ